MGVFACLHPSYKDLSSASVTKLVVAPRLGVSPIISVRGGTLRAFFLRLLLYRSSVVPIVCCRAVSLSGEYVP